MHEDRNCVRAACGRRDVAHRDLPAALTDGARRWVTFLQTVVDHPDGVDRLLHRPASETWSARAYACHTRDAVAAVTRNIELLLLVDCPTLRPFDGDHALAHGWYEAQAPDAVGQDLRHVTAELAGLVQRHDEESLDRLGADDGVLVTGLTLARRALHEVRHHLGDAERAVPLPVP